MIPIPIRIQFCIASIMLYSARPRSGSRFHIVHDIIIMLLICLVYASIKVFGHPGRVFKLRTRLFCSSFLFNGLYGLRTPLLVFAVISVCSVHAFSLPSLGVDYNTPKSSVNIRPLASSTRPSRNTCASETPTRALSAMRKTILQNLHDI